MFSIIQYIILIGLILCILYSSLLHESFQSSGGNCTSRFGCNTALESIMGSLGSPAEFKYHCHQNLKDGASIITSSNKHIQNLGPQTAKALGGTCAQISKRKADIDRKRLELNATKQNLRSMRQLSDGRISSTSKYKATKGQRTIQGQIRETKSEIATQKEQIQKLQEQITRLEKR